MDGDATIDLRRDRLTGLANRAGLIRHCEDHPAAALVLVHLDERAADDVVLAVANRLVAAAGPNATVCRLGAGEFAVVEAAGPVDPSLDQYVHRLLDAVCAPMRFPCPSMTVHASAAEMAAPLSYLLDAARDARSESGWLRYSRPGGRAGQRVPAAPMVSWSVGSDPTATGGGTAAVAARLVSELSVARPQMAAHVERVRRSAERIASAVATGWGRDDGWVDAVAAAAGLHDVGQLLVPADLLDGPGPLTHAERALVQAHTQLGGMLVAARAQHAGVGDGDVQLLRNVAELHHELLDGSGYPHGLRGDDIPDEARVVAVADTFDALSEEPSPGGTRSSDQVRSMMWDLATSHRLDRSCVEALLDTTPAG